jgi:hypothetical protein
MFAGRVRLLTDGGRTVCASPGCGPFVVCSRSSRTKSPFEQNGVVPDCRDAGHGAKIVRECLAVGAALGFQLDVWAGTGVAILLNEAAEFRALPVSSIDHRIAYLDMAVELDPP